VRFLAIFVVQKATRVVGSAPRLHEWPCQKQPCTQIASFAPGTEKSGVPGNDVSFRITR
jgi:hypothetical protein